MKAASFLSPFVYLYLGLGLADQEASGGLVIRLAAAGTPAGLPRVSIYLLFTLVSLLMTLIIISIRFSVMYAIIFSLAPNSVSGSHGSFSGILSTGIAGGAIVSLIVGRLKDLLGLQAGMMALCITLAYILSISFWAKPIVSNATIKRKK